MTCSNFSQQLQRSIFPSCTYANYVFVLLFVRLLNHDNVPVPTAAIMKAECSGAQKTLQISDTPSAPFPHNLSDQYIYSPGDMNDD